MTDDMLSEDEFFAALERYGIRRTGTNEDGVWLCRKGDGQPCTIPAYDRYPTYVLEKVLMELGLYYLPMYNSNQ